MHPHQPAVCAPQASMATGELSLEAERRLHSLWRRAEAEVLAEADVVCVTCIGAGDKRLRKHAFPAVRVLLGLCVFGWLEGHGTVLCHVQ